MKTDQLVVFGGSFWAHSMGPQRSPLSRGVVVVVDIDAQAAFNSTASNTW